MDEKHNTSLERGAANDIVRLRWRIRICENIIARLQAENERLRTRATHATPSECSMHPRLTDEEREAIREGADALYGGGYDEDAATLRKLLERLS
jgi:hypothetical protein